MKKKALTSSFSVDRFAAAGGGLTGSIIIKRGKNIALLTQAVHRDKEHCKKFISVNPVLAKENRADWAAVISRTAVILFIRNGDGTCLQVNAIRKGTGLVKSSTGTTHVLGLEAGMKGWCEFDGLVLKLKKMPKP